MKDGLRILLALALLFWTAVLSLSCSGGTPTGDDVPVLQRSDPPDLHIGFFPHERSPDNSLYGLQGKIESLENGLARGWVRSARQDRVEVFLACYRLTSPGGQWPNGQEVYDYKVKEVGPVGQGDYVQFVVRVPGCYQCDIGRGDENVVVNKLWTQVLDGRFSNAGCVPERKPKLPPPPADTCPDGQVRDDEGQCYTPCDGPACGGEQTCEELGNCSPPPPPIQHGACVYEVAGRKDQKRAVCEGLGGTFDNHDGSDHCVFAFPGISNNQLNLAPGLSDADCLRKQN